MNILMLTGNPPCFSVGVKCLKEMLKWSKEIGSVRSKFSFAFGIPDTLSARLFVFYLYIWYVLYNSIKYY